MLILNRNNVQIIYTAVQALYWLTYGLMFAFASTYLQSLGFSDWEIGLILGFSYAASALLQPLLSDIFFRSRLRMERAMCCVYGILLFFSSLLLLVALPRQVRAVFVVLLFSLQSALQPSINALASRWNAVSPVDFGSSRGFSSLLYAIMTVCVGLLLKIMPPFFLPTFYLKTMGMLFCILFLTVLPDSARQEEPTADFSSNFRLGSVMNGSFAFLFLGIFCLSVGHIMIDNFMLQIMQSVGGNSENLGIAVSVAALVEFPAMKSYRFLSSRFGNARILVFSAFAWVIKNLLIFLASSPSVICAAETLQFFSYALYTPGIVTYIGEKYPKNEQLCRLSLVGSAYTAGSIASASIGGLLLDFFGVHSALLSIIPITLVGALLFIAAVRRDCPSIECCSTSEKTNR